MCAMGYMRVIGLVRWIAWCWNMIDTAGVCSSLPFTRGHKKRAHPTGLLVSM
jgi:hypothetical protein